MLENLIQLTSDLLDKGEVGTLFLGKGETARRMFFTGEDVYLLQDCCKPRIVPVKQLFQTDRISASATEEVYAEIRKGDQAPADVLIASGLLRETDRTQYEEMERLEDILYALETSRDHFTFDAGNVPEEILRIKPGADQGTPAPVLLAAIGQRLSETSDVVRTFPRSDELPVISESGLAARNEPKHWLFGQVAALVDGFRTIHKITEDSVFYPHRSLQILCAATRKGWIRKTLFREFQNLEQREIDAESAPEVIAQLVSAAEMSVDDLPLRRHLVRLYQIVGDPTRASQQLELIGDQHRGRRDQAKALASYQSALELEPDSAQLKARVLQMTTAEATAAVEAGRLDDARQWYEEAIQVCPERADLRIQYLSTFTGDETLIGREALRIADDIQRTGEPASVIEFMAAAVQEYPYAENARRRLVNLLLDEERCDEAIRELDTLACQLVEQGEPERANEILQKIGRLDPKRAIARDSITDPDPPTQRRRRFRPSAAALSLVALFVIFGAYQHIVYKKIFEKREAFAKMVEIDLAEISEEQYPSEIEKSRAFLGELDELEDSYPFAIWIHPLQQIRLAAENRVDFVESKIRRSLNSLLTQAREAHIRGQLERAFDLYGQLEKRALNDSWRAEARTQMQEITVYRQLSGSLLTQGKTAEKSGDLEQAFHAYRELLIEFPRSEAARGVRLPLRIESKPDGVTVKDAKGRPLGKAPLDIQVHPWEPTELILVAPDGRKLSVRVEDPIQYRQVYPFPRIDD